MFRQRGIQLRRTRTRVLYSGGRNLDPAVGDSFINGLTDHFIEDHSLCHLGCRDPFAAQDVVCFAQTATDPVVDTAFRSDNYVATA